MAAKNQEFEDGYKMGYDWVSHEGGRPSYWIKEMNNRGVSPRTQWAVGFKKGAEDSAFGKPRAY